MSSIGSSTGVDTLFSTRDLRPLCFNDKHFPDLLGSDDESGVEVLLSLRPGNQRRGGAGNAGGSSGNLASLEDRTPSEGACSRVKLMCSFGGKIMPRPSDGKLRYVGGETRIATVNRDIQYSELMARMCELCDQSILVKYQMPEEDLDALISVCNGEDLENMMEEYDRLENSDLTTRLRVFLFPVSDYDLDFLEPASLDSKDPDQAYIDAVNGTLDLATFRKDAGTGDSVSGSVSNSNCNDLIGLEAYASSFQGDSTDLSSLMHASTSTVNGSLATSSPASPIFTWPAARDIAGQATVNFYGVFEGGQVNTNTNTAGTGICRQQVLDTETSSTLKGAMDSSPMEAADKFQPDDVKRVPDLLQQQEQQQQQPPSFIPNGQSPHLENMFHRSPSFHGVVCHGLPPTSGYNHFLQAPAPCLAVQGRCLCVAPQLQVHIPSGRHHQRQHCGGYHATPPPCCCDDRRPLWWHQYQACSHCGLMLENQMLNKSPTPPLLPAESSPSPTSMPWPLQNGPSSPLLQAESSSSSSKESKMAWPLQNGNLQNGPGILQNGPGTLQNGPHRLEQGFSVQTFGQQITEETYKRTEFGGLSEAGVSHFQAEPQSGLTLTSMKDSYPDSRHEVTESSASSSRLSLQQCGTASVSDSVLGHLSGGADADNTPTLQRSPEVESPMDAKSPIDAKIQQFARLLEDSLQENRAAKTGKLSNLMDDVKLTFAQDAASSKKSELPQPNNTKPPDPDVEPVVVTTTTIRTVQQAIVQVQVADDSDVSEKTSEPQGPVLPEGSESSIDPEVLSRHLQRISNCDIEEIKQLGSGTFGTVYYGKWRNSDVAIKRLKASCFTQRPSEKDRMIADFWREAVTLANLSHPNVVAFYGVVPDGPDGTLATVTEYMVNGSLKQVLQRKDRTIDRRKRIQLAMDAACGMEYLHAKKIVHFDLKSENLLVNMRDPHHPVCKVGDFGLSKVKRQTMVSGGVRGTLPWMAPELLSSPNNMVTEKVDVFSFGIVMWELLTGEEPYRNMHHGEIIGGIVKNNLRPEIPMWCEPLWKNLMVRCWAAEPADRPSFSEVARELRAMSASLQQGNNLAQQACNAAQ